MLSESILSHLILDDKYSRAVLPHLKPEYFSDVEDRTLFNLTYEHVSKFNVLPSKEVLAINLDKEKGLNDEQFESLSNRINNLQVDNLTNHEWLVDQTEQFCKDKAIYNAIVESIAIIDKKNDKSNLGTGVIPDLLTAALSISFDSSIGHDYLENFEARYEFYHTSEHRIPFHLDYMNRITKGGIVRKTILTLLANTGVGKSLIMCDFAAGQLEEGWNVLYLTAEMSEEQISKRIDANLMNVTIDELETLPKDSFMKKAARVRSKAKGKLIVKEYPTSSAHAGHVRHLLQELKLKQKFVPDVIYIDYLNIFASSRARKESNSYEKVKMIAEEFRGLAIEFNVAIITATQSVRSAAGNSDVDITDVSESFGLAHTVDMLLAVMSSEELDELGQYVFKQLKNRYAPLARHRRFVIGVDKDKMRLYDVEESIQSQLHENMGKKKSKTNRAEEDASIMDKSEFGQRAKEDDEMKFMTKKAGKRNFDGFG